MVVVALGASQIEDSRGQDRTGMESLMILVDKMAAVYYTLLSLLYEDSPLYPLHMAEWSMPL